ncbi:MAG: gliding motility-associated C-terminal domain-containing protein [Cyclobacteriaceae bacterium]
MRTLLFIAYILSFTCQAQVISQLGRFQVLNNKGCAPLTVNITTLDTLGDVTRLFSYGDSEQTGSLSHTFETPGTYDIVELIGANIIPRFDTLTIQVFEPIPPSIDYSNCSSEELLITISDQNYDQYDLNVHDQIYSLISNQSIVLPTQGQNALNVAVEGIYSNALQNCGQTEVTIPITPFQLNAHILDLSFQYVCYNEIDLAMDLDADSSTSYQIEIAFDAETPRSLFIGNITSGTLLFNGVSFPRNVTELCARVNAVNPCDDELITGEWLCITLDISTSAFDTAYATYNENQGIQFIFTDNPNGDFKADKFVDSEYFITLDSVYSASIDTVTYPLRKYEYELIFIPGCRASEQRIRVAPPHLSYSSDYPNNYDFTWTSPIYQMDDTVDYFLMIADENQSNIKETPLFDYSFNTNLTHELGHNQYIWVEARFTNSQLILYSNTSTISYEYHVYVPQTFSPNDDGINDRLQIFGLPGTQFVMKIFNIWGDLVFTTTDLSNMWDGTNRAGTINAGAFVYQIEFSNEEGELFTQQGSFVISK